MHLHIHKGNSLERQEEIERVILNKLFDAPYNEEGVFVVRSENSDRRRFRLRCAPIPIKIGASLSSLSMWEKNTENNRENERKR